MVPNRGVFVKKGGVWTETTPHIYDSSITPITSIPITITVIGAGGGGGGNDAGDQGHPGYPGKSVTGSYVFNITDVMSIAVGGRGGQGQSGVRGGTPGQGGTNKLGYTGGRGGLAGQNRGSSGTGGGGGGASVVILNDSVYIVAGGGAGGGGAGNEGLPGKASAGYQSNSTNYGGAGQDKDWDGGGGGGGGGGQWGGKGGLTYGGDEGAYSGSNGASLIPSGYTESNGTNGGATASAGQNGVIQVSYNSSTPLLSGGLVNVTIGIVNTVTHTFSNPNAVETLTVGAIPTNWVPLKAGYVNVSGTWQQFFPSNGFAEFTSPGVYKWTVPAGVYRITVDAVAGGGGGGGGMEVGNGDAGGGGGSGGYTVGQTMSVTPGEVLTITVGPGGTGAPYVGRTQTAPDGQPGGDSAVNGSIGSVLVTGGGQGLGGNMAEAGGSNGGGGKIICTKLYELGLLSKEIFEADQAFGAELVKTRPDIYNGYRAWAEIVVDWMSGKGPQMMFWIKDPEARKQAQMSWATNWAKEIATPWAEWMATRNNKTGAALMAIGAPISKVVGVWQRWFGPSKKPAGFIKGLLLIKVFIVLRAIVALGKLLGK